MGDDNCCNSFEIICVMRRILNVVFDFDGTLADTAPLIVETMRGAMAELGLPGREERVLRASIGLRLEEVPAVVWPGAGVDGELFARTYRRIFEERKEGMKVSLFRGVEDTLRWLYKAGIGMAIATSRSRRSLEEYLERLGVRGLFAMTVGGDDVSRGKPDGEPVEKILQALGWEAERTLTVGDAPVDVAMGRAASTLTCGVTYGNCSRELMSKSRPDYLFDDFGALYVIL